MDLEKDNFENANELSGLEKKTNSPAAKWWRPRRQS